ncbi:rRNA maturation RNase YbeY [Leptospira borgpetersenii]|uniref:rRNA maturation RNase YbeY n=1 Tax=Leptospira borgpetersenii TaxID=174 RepID=UPI000774283B|nr:rRNA maturation RNase YbeY [Leptospira borgpetersenii]MBE8364208.1 rRNA maturation RNase YbeY [Leptospira borgpetersenii serovar Balcanica]MBE8367998.1 rRNA maturation RNase YbeY [Leptospira borgpetersenii serovar Balcanica]MBE8401339.1 rRNA maturation RNase YbeY [Leptospira borgpetersenii serovar Tarassovi]MBE8403574.1 rRNA maturation RNase YbeY [Leptospira borgpetersenii serovar Tarassovi]MBE8407484.1 rRNA maturation RNase YbeY [Leptospira borgpetersenii serovar Tarassovi]
MIFNCGILFRKELKDFPCELGLLLVGDSDMRKINRLRRGKDKTTDVLSFPLEFDSAPLQNVLQKRTGFDSNSLPPIALGEIVISVDTLEKQAVEIGHSVKDEFYRLLVHGFLHLLGYNHERGEEEERIMKLKEDECLEILQEL